MDYTTIQKVEKLLTIDIEAGQEAEVATWVTAMSRYADKYCNRVLVVAEDVVATQRKFSGTGGQVLHIDECTGITEVLDADGNAITDYTTYPLNKDYVQAIYKEGMHFMVGVGNYRVTAVWGQSASNTVPEDLALAVSILVAGVINFSRSGGDNVASEKVGQYSVSYKNQQERDDYKTAIKILDSYKRLAF